MGPLICLSLPLAAATLVSVFCPKKGGDKLAVLSRKYPAIRTLIAIALMALGVGGSFALDKLDVSDLIFSNAHNTLTQVTRLKEDLEGVHKMSGPSLISVRNQIDEIVNGLKQPQSDLNESLLALVVGVCGGCFLVLSVFHTSADTVLEAKLTALESELERSDKQQKSLWHAFKQIEIIVVAKLQRIRRVLDKNPPPKTSSERLLFCQNALSPTEQLQSFVECVHTFFSRADKPNARHLVSVYIPNGDYLKVMASTDGKSPNVITSPNGQYSSYFNIRTGNPRASKVVEAFFAKHPIIVSSCSPSNFQYFSPEQHHEIKSVFACPLLYSSGEPLGVLFAESDTAEYFRNDESFELMLKQMGSQIALRLSLERCVSDLFSRLEESIKSETSTP